MSSRKPTLLTVDAARKFRRHYYDDTRTYTNSRGTLSRGMRRHQHGPLPSGHIQFINNANETVPRYGVMRIETQGELAEEGHVMVCNKPNSSFQSLYAVNLAEDVASGYDGVCAFLTEASPLGFDGHYALYNTAATPVVGQSWAPVANSWYLHQHGPGFGIIGSPIANEARVAVLQIPPAEILVKNATGSSIAAGSSGTFQVWGGVAGSEANSGQTVTAYNRTSIAFQSNKFGAVGFLNGQAYAVPFQT